MNFKSTRFINSQAILFFAFLLTTSYFNHFAADDFYFIGELRTHSLTEIYQQLYFEWHGRWTSNFLLLSMLQFYKAPAFLMLYNIFSIGILYLSIARLTKALFKKFGLKQKHVFAYALVFLSVLFFCTVSPSDSWFWYTSSIVYLWSAIAFFIALQLFVGEKSLLNYFLFVIGAIYMGGSNEPMAIISILLLAGSLIKGKNKLISILGIVLIGGSFLIDYLSPGTRFRDGITPSLGSVDLVIYTGYSSLKFLFSSLFSSFILALFLSLPFYLLGNTIDKKIVPQFTPVRALVKSVLIIGGIIILNQLIVVYALGGLAPERSTIISSILISMVLVRYLFLLGNYHQKKYKWLQYVLIINVLGLIIFNIYYFNVHCQYAKAVDERMEFIQNNPTKIIKVKGLPNSGYIYSAEITSDTTNFKNQHLKSGLNLKNDVVLDVNGH